MARLRAQLNVVDKTPSRVIAITAGGCFASPGGSTRFAPPRATVEDGPNDGLTACRDLDAGSHGRTREVKRSTPRLPLAHLVQTGSPRLQTGHPQTAVHEDPSGRDQTREPTRRASSAGASNDPSSGAENGVTTKTRLTSTPIMTLAGIQMGNANTYFENRPEEQFQSEMLQGKHSVAAPLPSGIAWQPPLQRKTENQF